MRLAPMASAIVTTAGRASGMAATARLTAVKNISSGTSSRSRPAAKTIAQITRIDAESQRPKLARRFCSGVIGRSCSRIKVAIMPSSV